MSSQTTLQLINALVGLEFNHSVKKIAEMAFPNNTHLQDKAKNSRSLFAFYGDLDTSNRKTFCNWLESYANGHTTKTAA